MPIRVIAGSAKGRRLELVPGDSTRPIMDRVKEALFNIIGTQINGANFLDLFSGTGSIGIEALSRGANRAVLVELNRRAVQTIRRNLEITGLGDRAVIRQTDVFSFLKRAPTQHYNYIYIAPPQCKGLWLDTLKALNSNPVWIPTGTTVIVQIDPVERKEFVLEHLAEFDRRRYGNTLLWFFEGRESQPDTIRPEE
jgi:16S rRNA (guanine(966)-N(2))-methyltransferase RsmD